MRPVLEKTWQELLRPMIFRPKRVQVAALCYRKGKSGTEVLLISSRGTGRWIIPKGWPIKGKDGAESALQEAWEEAGVRAAMVDRTPCGSYDYVKTRDNGTREPIETIVYSAQVDHLADDYPERHQRKREWFPAKKASDLVNEPQLKTLLRQL